MNPAADARRYRDAELARERAEAAKAAAIRIAAKEAEVAQRRLRLARAEAELDALKEARRGRR